MLGQRVDGGFAYLILGLACVGGCLFAAFSFLATTTVSEGLAFVVFLGVAFLLIVGYACGLMFVALAAFTLLAKRSAGKQGQMKNPT